MFLGKQLPTTSSSASSTSSGSNFLINNEEDCNKITSGDVPIQHTFTPKDADPLSDVSLSSGFSSTLSDEKSAQTVEAVVIASPVYSSGLFDGVSFKPDPIFQGTSQVSPSTKRKYSNVSQSEETAKVGNLSHKIEDSPHKKPSLGWNLPETQKSQSKENLVASAVQGLQDLKQGENGKFDTFLRREAAMAAPKLTGTFRECHPSRHNPWRCINHPPPSVKFELLTNLSNSIMRLAERLDMMEEQVAGILVSKTSNQDAYGQIVEDFAAMVSEMHNDVAFHHPGAVMSDIIIDSAASSHMINHLDGLFMQEPCDTTVRLADGSAVRVTLKGRIRLSLLDARGDAIILELHSVLYVPSLSRSLFSVPAFLRHRGNSVTFLPDRITFRINYTLVASIPKNNFDHLHAMAIECDVTTPNRAPTLPTYDNTISENEFTLVILLLTPLKLLRLTLTFKIISAGVRTHLPYICTYVPL
jgi:hypothetical protein